MAMRFFAVCASVVLACSLGACSSSTGSKGSASAPATQAVNPKLQQSLKLYQDLRAKRSYALAGPIGAGVVARHPHSSAAQEIEKTLADTQQRAAAINEARRLQGLWLYQTGLQSGARQSTASIKPSTPAGAREHIEMVLRRHAKWGLSAYLYDHGGKGFVCRGHCRLTAVVDGKPRHIEAYLPPSHDPALFIAHAKRFIAIIEQAHTVDLGVKLRDGTAETLKFEVAGFKPNRWVTLKP